MATLTQAVAQHDPRLERRLRARLDAAVTRLAVMACVLGGAVMRAVGALQAAMRHDHRRGALAERKGVGTWLPTTCADRSIAIAFRSRRATLTASGNSELHVGATVKRKRIDPPPTEHGALWDTRCPFAPLALPIPAAAPAEGGAAICNGRWKRQW